MSGCQLCQTNMQTLCKFICRCGGSKVFTTTIIFKKCGGKPSFGGQERYVKKTHLELPYPNPDDNVLSRECHLYGYFDNLSEACE